MEGWKMRTLIVGASGGLGSAFVSLLAADTRVTQVTAWSRSAAVVTGDKISQKLIDLRDEATIEAAAQSLGNVDLVIIATGLLHDGDLNPEKSWRSLEPSTMIRAFEINTIGPALVAKHVLPLLPFDRRAVFAALSARVGSISDNRLGGWHSYRASKAALNQLIRCFSIELAVKRPQAICVGLHPGTVDTALSKPYQGGVPDGQLFATQQAARHLLGVIDSLKRDQSGRVFDWAGVEIQA
jgi:NAD(P)-dependent dehydrogenase (short-subunit alcohol dehydrogenase family)